MTPEELFREWLEDAGRAGGADPRAMTLATVDADGRPDARVVILRHLGDGRWGFSTSRLSPKARQLAVTPWAALTFHWPQVGRQVRIRGRVLDAGQAEAAVDFLARHPASRAEAASERQSEVLEDPTELERALRAAIAEARAHPDWVPEHWTRYDLVADTVEFWELDPDRRHRRLRYALRGGVWTRERLWP